MQFFTILFGILLLNYAVGTAQTQDWKTESEQDGVTVLSRTADCSDPANGIFNDYLLLKVVNANDHQVSISFYRSAWFDGRCNGCQEPTEEHRTVLTLGPTSMAEGTCASGDKQLKVFSKKRDIPGIARLTRFEVGNLSVTEANSGR
ncbi:MAG: hypothetical protein K9J06_07510 [Flavobacteriales bacterium]|nr:hypothetical protein [Flavobacteriales bacterium]